MGTMPAICRAGNTLVAYWIGYASTMEIEGTPNREEENESGSQDVGTGSGEGGDLGTPSGLPEEAPPSADQEANEAVSGGGMVDPSTESEAKDTVDK